MPPSFWREDVPTIMVFEEAGSDVPVPTEVVGAAGIDDDDDEEEDDDAEDNNAGTCCAFTRP